jgi:plasmid stabilization system protein ParE
MEIELHPEAELEFIESSAYYESRVLGLGEKFINELEGIKLVLLSNPRIGAPVNHIFRKALFRRFPYSVIYTIKSTRIWVLAIAHHRRRPGYWRERYDR